MTVRGAPRGLRTFGGAGVTPSSADVPEVDTDVVLSEQDVRVAILRVNAREDLVIARQTAELITAG